MGAAFQHRTGVLTRLLVAASLAGLGLAGGARAEIIDRVLAVVGGHIITLSDVRAATALGLVNTAGAADPIGAALDHLIGRELMLGEVERYQPPEPGAAAVAELLKTVRGRFPSEAAFGEALRLAGTTDARLRETLRDELRIQAYLDERFAGAARPTDEEVGRYVDEHRADFVRDGRPLPVAAALDAARDRLAAERRRALIAEWISELRTRADVTNLYLTSR
jgi:hypothetical protein